MSPRFPQRGPRSFAPLAAGGALLLHSPIEAAWLQALAREGIGHLSLCLRIQSAEKFFSEVGA